LKLHASYPESLYVNSLGTKRTLIKESIGSLVLDGGSGVLNLVYTDSCGPFPTAYWNSYRYFITFIDHYTRYGYLYLIHDKSQSLDIFKIYKAEFENQRI